ncbi:MAG: glycine zipper family protein [Planctomycetes bacterium]|nr:glycine zipper family protein [Planctomycetota bacterium]
MAPTQPSTQFPLRYVALACLLGSAGVLSGCNDAQAGALLGAGIGALAGQAIGRDTEATLIGTAVGAGAGYIIGNESDKAKHQRDHNHGNYDY